MYIKRPTENGYVVYRDEDFQFVVERGAGYHFNCVALIPAKDFTKIIDSDMVLKQLRSAKYESV